MGWTALFAIAFSLSLDAFAVATIAGTTLDVPSLRQRLRLSFHFAAFEAMMLTGGWYLGSFIVRLLHGMEAWVAFALLTLVGGNIVRNALRNVKGERHKIDPTRGWELVFLCVASSLDALAVGISLAMVKFPILRSALVVGVVGFGMTLLGVELGRKIGTIWGRRCELIGGIVLIFMGLYFLWPVVRGLRF